MNKKITLCLGSIAAIGLPVSAVVSCDLFGNKDDNKDKDGNIDLVSSAKLETVSVTGSNGAFTVILPKGKTITTDKVKALFKGVGTLTVTNDDNFDGSKAGEYKFTIKDSGKGKKVKEATATLTITVKASWNPDLPAGTIYASKANQGQFTKTKTDGVGYAAVAAGKTKTIPPSPNDGDTVTIDGTVHSFSKIKMKYYDLNGSNSGWNTKANDISNYGFLSRFKNAYELPKKELSDVMANNGTSNSAFPWLLGTPKSIYVLDHMDVNLLVDKQNQNVFYYKKDLTQVDITSKSFISGFKANDEIYLYNQYLIPTAIKIKFVANQNPTWSPALPPSSTTLYELKANTTEYTADETKASGYVAKKDPDVKTKNDLVKAAQKDPNKKITIDGQTYTLS